VRELRDRKHEHEVEEQLNERHAAVRVAVAIAQEASTRVNHLVIYVNSTDQT
jgi:hypothetical protein